MFKWTHEYSVELDLPSSIVAEFYNNSENWPKWIDSLISCTQEKKSETEYLITGLTKRKTKIFIKTFVNNNATTILIRLLFYKQESTNIYHDIAPNKTLLTFKCKVTSPLVVFCKSRMIKDVEKQYLTSIKILKDS